ncbi:MAG: FxsA family protein [Candidatus Omnitrophota bacterium]
MFRYLILLFTILPALELALLIKVGTHIGAGNTILLIILTGVVGVYLTRLQGFFIIKNIQSRLSNGELPSIEMIDGLMIFCGGILLLTPGFITDILGFLLLIPFTRSMIKSLVRHKLQQSLYREGTPGRPHLHSDYFYNNYEDADFKE